MEPSNELLPPLPAPNSSTPGSIGAQREALVRHWIKAIGLGLLAAGITLCVFCPRLFAWEALGVPGLEYLPEVNRANFVMLQLNNPWVVVTNIGNSVIMWRLLFPIIWYILGLPATAFLAVPMIGCWAVLAFATHRIKIVTGQWLWAFVGAIVLSSCSWFFISMGWLTYADSWIVLAFVAIVYARSPWSLLAVGILAPWIDERFVIGLPLAIFVRTLHPAGEPLLATRNPMEWIACLPGVIVYVGIRLWALATRDHTSATFLTANLDRVHEIGVPAVRYALGVWQGIRAGWIFVGWAIIEAFRRSGKWARVFLVAITVPSLILMLMIAADLSRAPIILLVCFLPGIEYAWRLRPKAAKLLLCLAAAVNFLTPAYQVVQNFSIRIEPLWKEVGNLRHPPPGFNAQILTHRATGELFGKSDWAGALELLNAAVADDPGFLDAQIGRAFALGQLGRPLDALHECQIMLNSHPDSPNAWIVTGQVFFQLKRWRQARTCWTRALALLPADNPIRDSVRQSLQHLPRDAAGPTSTTAPNK